MKKLIFIAIMVMSFNGLIQAQDLIINRNGEDLQAKVLEITQTEVKYKKSDNLTGPTYILPKSDILMIRYENGTNEVFAQPENQATTDERSISTNIQPNMPYKYYKDMYNHRLYVPRYDDPYNPFVSGLCSFFIPGLGQMIAGETGRGLGYLGGYVGCNLLFVIGTNSVAYGDDSFGAIAILAGFTGMITVQICSIVDGVRVAKKKNMYLRDVRNNTSSINFSINPYVETVSIGNELVTPVGLSLKISF